MERGPGEDDQPETVTKSRMDLKPEFLNGGRLALFWLRFGVCSGKYLLQREKYPLFLTESLRLTRDQGLPGKIRVVRFADHYYAAILRIPSWPSQPFDQMMANGGFNIKKAGTPWKPQVDSAILAMTRRCRNHCKHCYEYTNLAEEESVPIQRWKEVLREIQRVGVSIVVFSGGEPLLRYDGLVELLESGDKSLSDFHVHTSGEGLTFERAMALKAAGLTAAGVSLDDFDPARQDEFRGHEGAHQESVLALRYFRQAGILPYVNLCLRKDLVQSDRLWKFYGFVRSLDACFIVLLEPKPWGGYHHEDAEDLFSDEDRRCVTEFFKRAGRDRRYKDYPLIFYAPYFEKPERLGCLMGGLSHFYVDSLGHVRPCVFLPVSFGNIMREDFSRIYDGMRRAIPAPLHKQCPALSLAATIKKKESQGAVLPIAYGEIKEEWERMFAYDPRLCS